MFIIDLYRRIYFDLKADRIGPDIPFTHWKLYFSRIGHKLCTKKFKRFGLTAQFRAGAYAVGCSKIEIGERVVIRPGCRLFGETTALKRSIVIEDDVMLGSGVSIYINNHRFDDTSKSIIDQGHYPPKMVALKKGCWVGANSILLPGVEIGHNSVIGAGSVVTKAIPDNVLAAGSPCRVIRNL